MHQSKTFFRLNIDVKVKGDEDEEDEQTGSKIHQNENFRINQEGRSRKLSESLSLQKASSSNCQTRERERTQTKAPNGLFFVSSSFLSLFHTEKKNKKLEILMWSPASRATAIKTASLWVYTHRH